MNKKKLFFLVFLTISSNSVSLFGMEDDSEKPNEEIKKENDTQQQPDTQEEKNNKNVSVEDIIYYLLYQDSILYKKLLKIESNQKKKVSNETKRNKKNDMSEQLDYNNGKPLWAKISSSPKTELEYNSNVLNKKNINNYEPENSTKKIHQQKQFKEGVDFLKLLTDFYKQQQEDQNPNENQKQPLQITDGSASQNIIFDSDYLIHKNKTNDNEPKSKPKKLFGYKIFNSQQQENKNQNENFEQNWQERDGREYNRPKKKTNHNNIEYDYLSNMPKHRKDFLTKSAIEEGFKQGTMTRVAQRIIAQKPIGDAVKEGAIAGLEQGTATVVATLIFMLAQTGIAKGVELWNQPSKEDLQNMELQQLLESLEKNIEKKQKLLMGNSAIITTVGQNVEQAQRIFEEQLHQKQEEFLDKINNNDQIKGFIYLQAEVQKQQEIANFEKNLVEECEQKIKEFKQKQGIVYSSSPSPEQSRKSDEFIKQLEKDMAEKSQHFLIELEKKYTPEKQKEDFVKKALIELSQTSPDAKFFQLFNDYADMASDTLKTQKEMMDGTFVNNLYTMFKESEATKAA